MYYDLNLVDSGSHFIHRSSVPLTVLERVVGASIMGIGEQGDTHLTTCTTKHHLSFPCRSNRCILTLVFFPE